MLTAHEIQTRVEETLLSDDRLDARHIRVVVRGNEVWLEGEVPTPDMYDLADRITNTIGGAGTVTNNLVTTGQAYDLFSRYNDDIRLLAADTSTDPTADNRIGTRMGPFGEEHDEPEEDETDAMGGPSGGPVGGDSGKPIHPMDMNELAPLSTDFLNAEEPWRYQDDGPNAHLEPEPVLPPDEDEV
jgi:hypothetical protein